MGNAMANLIVTSTVKTTHMGGTFLNCGPPPGVNDASVDIIFKHIANYTCNDGYNMTGSPTNLTCDQGQWVGNAPKCNPGFLDIDPYELSENVPLWLALTLAAIGTCAALVACCCIVAVCCMGKNRKRRKVANSEKLSAENQKSDGVSSQQNRINTQKSNNIITVQEIQAESTEQNTSTSMKGE